MRAFFGLLLQIVGWAATAWSLVVGLSFSGVYLMGYIGTKGREAGDMLPWMLTFTVVAPLLGYGVVRIGRRLSESGVRNHR